MERDIIEWKNGYDKGVNSVFEFIDEMTHIDLKKFKKHFNAWCNADDYVTLDGIKVDRCK